jgi:glycerophosphoryl diester phosphodiesterase
MRLILSITILLSFLHVTAQTAKIPEAEHAFTVIAHRGDHLDVPENTLAAFKRAIDDEADFVEVDLRTTKDSVLIIMHDATVDRMTNGKGNVSELTYAEIKKLKIKDPKSNYTVPTFEEVLRLCRNKIYVYLDFKNANVPQTFELIKKYKMERQVIVYINEPFQYFEWRKYAPSIPLMKSLPAGITTEASLKNFLAESPVELLDGDYTDYTAPVLQAAKRLDVAVWPDIQGAGEDKNWDKALDMGFTGLQTDHPSALIQYLTSRKRR